MKNEAWWVSTKDFLPDKDERVLVISKFGHVSNARYTDMGLGGDLLFEPDGFKPHIDVKWWMPIPTDGWIDVRQAVPRIGAICLTMGLYGQIYSGIWQAINGSPYPAFQPFVFPVLYWRAMPKLPDGVKLSFR